LPGARQTLERVLGKSDAQQFFRVLRAEQQMNRTYSSQFGSQTTPLREAIDDLNWAPRFEGSWRNLGLGWAMRHASEWVARNINNARNEQLMRLYTETNPLAQIDTLRAVSGVQNARTAAGQRYGAPVIASAGPAANALLGVEHGNLVGAQPPPFARERR